MGSQYMFFYQIRPALSAAGYGYTAGRVNSIYYYFESSVFYRFHIYQGHLQDLVDVLLDIAVFLLIGYRAC